MIEQSKRELIYIVPILMLAGYIYQFNKKYVSNYANT